jgi:hypothetical protein
VLLLPALLLLLLPDLPYPASQACLEGRQHLLLLLLNPCRLQGAQTLQGDLQLLLLLQQWCHPSSLQTQGVLRCHHCLLLLLLLGHQL